MTAPPAPPPGLHLLFDFRAAPFAPWSAIDDRVMGGASRSRLVPSGAGSALFVGEVVLEGGGFASVRSAPGAYGRPGAMGIVVCARGDGRRYKLALRDSPAFDGPVWQAAFAPPERFAQVALPLSTFTPTLRGRPLGPPGGLEAAAIASVGLVLTGGRGGPFRLEVAWLAADR
jgi:NADH dehydrogenase [ubiquinone] 1 alpha subcomplex assembly factor 1